MPQPGKARRYIPGEFLTISPRRSLPERFADAFPNFGFRVFVCVGVSVSVPLSSSVSALASALASPVRPPC
eukprot:7700639-Alexandrium_andersonii.AAC.1